MKDQREVAVLFLVVRAIRVRPGLVQCVIHIHTRQLLAHKHALTARRVLFMYLRKHRVNATKGIRAQVTHVSRVSAESTKNSMVLVLVKNAT